MGADAIERIAENLNRAERDRRKRPIPRTRHDAGSSPIAPEPTGPIYPSALWILRDGGSVMTRTGSLTVSPGSPTDSVDIDVSTFDTDAIGPVLWIVEATSSAVSWGGTNPGQVDVTVTTSLTNISSSLYFVIVGLSGGQSTAIPVLDPQKALDLTVSAAFAGGDMSTVTVDLTVTAATVWGQPDPVPAWP